MSVTTNVSEDEQQLVFDGTEDDIFCDGYIFFSFFSFPNSELAFFKIVYQFSDLE